jgi:acyl-CoA thioesterase-1
MRGVGFPLVDGLPVAAGFPFGAGVPVEVRFEESEVASFMAGKYPIFIRLLLLVGAVVAGTTGALAAGTLGTSGAPVISDAPGAAAASTPSASVPAPAPPLVVFLGDSLTAGYGLSEDEAYPAIVAKKLAAAGHPIRFVNAGVSGDTSAGGLRRLDWVLKQKPDVLVVGLGANDALRGQPIEGLETNLRAIVTKARGAGAKVLLLGMRIPTSYGPEYTEKFAAVYPKLAKEMKIALVPFLLERVGGHPELTQPDGLHPTADGQRIVAENVRPYLEKVSVGVGGPTKAKAEDSGGRH